MMWTMAITSGGGGRERLAEHLAVMDNNVYGLLYGGTVDPVELAERLVPAGWSARKASWDEYELTNEWCSFVLGKPGGQLKLAGVVAPDRLDDLAATWTSISIGCDLELYDGDLLVRELRIGPDDHR
jgi:hypothetical protein